MTQVAGGDLFFDRGAVYSADQQQDQELIIEIDGEQDQEHSTSDSVSGSLSTPYSLYMK